MSRPKRISLPVRHHAASEKIHQKAVAVANREARDLAAPAPPPPTAGDLAIERHRIDTSNSITQSIKEAALKEPCREHDAEAGEFCFAYGRSVCAHRIEMGKMLWPASLYRREIVPGELEPLAAETRLGQRDARIRANIERTRERARTRNGEQL